MMSDCELHHALPLNQVQLLGGEMKRRYDLNRDYVMSLTNRNLLQNFYRNRSGGDPLNEF